MISLSALARPIFLGALILFLSFDLQAVPPKTLDYQGYLANSSGVPLTGSVNLSVSLYDTASGGTSLWAQTSSPTLTNGRFTLVLDGSAGNPFPPSAFDQQLYVGLTVDTDPEMTPRQPLTSVPSAFEAINADTVDGLQANEIIDAASDEVRTPISSLPFTISTSGSYYLTQNLTATAPNGAQLGQIDINADNVTIDLVGFTLDGNGVNDYGINLQSSSAVEIKNGTIRGFGRAGIYGPSSNASVVVNVRALANGSLNGSGGEGLSYSGIYLHGPSHRVERCIAKDNGGSGIYVGVNSIVKDNSAENSGGTFGIFADNGSTIANNTAYNNQGENGYGIYSLAGSTLTNNTAHNNQGIGIGGGPGVTLTNNTAWNNVRWGIFAERSNIVIGNSVTHNWFGLGAPQGGLFIGDNSLVKDNSAHQNNGVNIYVGGTNNVLRNNHATDTGTCYYFNFNDNAAIANTAAGCTTGFAGSQPPAARFIDNINW